MAAFAPDRLTASQEQRNADLHATAERARQGWQEDLDSMRAEHEQLAEYLRRVRAIAVDPLLQGSNLEHRDRLIHTYTAQLAAVEAEITRLEGLLA